MDKVRRNHIKDHWLVWILGLAIAGFVLWTTQPAVQKKVCEHVLAGHDVAEWACDPEFQVVSTTDASAFMDSFLGRAGAADPREAWELMTPELQARTPLRDFSALWDVLWAERRGALDSEAGFNRWRVHYRTYGGATNEDSRGDINERSFSVQLQRVGDGQRLRLVDITSADRDDGGTVAYAGGYVRVSVPSYNLPSSHSRIAAPHLKAGGLLRILCSTQDQGGRLWARTPLGWIAVDDLDVRNWDPQAGAQCDPHHAEVASAL